MAFEFSSAATGAKLQAVAQSTKVLRGSPLLHRLGVPRCAIPGEVVVGWPADTFSRCRLWSRGPSPRYFW